MWRNEEAPVVASEYLSGLGRRWNHARSVGNLAERLAARGLISEAVLAAAWLHDLGYAVEIESTGFHPVDGAEFLVRVGAPDDVVSLVAHHTGAAYEAEERGFKSLLDEMPEADQDELDIVTFLDLVTAPDGSPTDPLNRIDEILSRYDEASPVHRAVMRSREALLNSADRARRLLGLPDEWPAAELQSVGEPQTH